MSFKSLIAANLLSPDIRFVRASTKVSKPMANDLFALLLSTVVIAGGSYFIYKLLFEDDKDIERPIPYKQPGSASTDNVEEEDDESGYRLRIFFGSQSGTAEGFAFDMEKEGKQHGFGAKAIDLEDFSPEDLCNEQLVIFLVATYGEGEPTDNAAEFYEWLSAEDERTDDELSKVQFAVFGLGNSQYEFFNQMGRHFDKFLEQYGGTRIFDRGEGDDDVGSIEDQFSEWKDALWPLLCEKYLGISEMSKAKFESSLSVQVLSEETVSAKYPIAKSIEFPYDLSNYSDTDINGERIDRKLYLPSRRKPYSDRIGICRMTSKHQLRQNTKDGSTFHLDFDLTFNKEYNSRNKVVQYETADNMGFIPRNDHKMVHKLCKKLGLNPNDIVRITPKDANATANYPFPEITSIKNLFLWYLDINAFPSTKMLKTLASDFIKDEAERKRIMEYCDNLKSTTSAPVLSRAESFTKFAFIEPEQKEEEAPGAADTFCPRTHLTLLDVLDQMKSLEIDLASMIELMKPLQPRLYTIASSSMVNANSVSVCIKLELEDPLPDSGDDDDEKQYLWKGVQSRYFLQSKVESKFQCYMEPSKFNLPAASTPVIMIGPGAGVAPFAAFVDEGDVTIKSKSKICKKDYGDWWLFFGCRHKDGDYIYKDKLERSYNDPEGVLTHLKVAFSRDQGKKVYVQHLIEENQEELWTLIDEKGAMVFVCGGTAMGGAVRDTFKRIFTFYDKGKDGAAYLDQMLKDEMYIQELWG